MIEAAHIARYRGIRELTVGGLSRVNLVIGKNNCGKTAFLEALQVAEYGEDAVHGLIQIQKTRLSRTVKTFDFERFWKPVFFDYDAKAGLSIAITRPDGAQQKLDIRPGDVHGGETILELDDQRDGRGLDEDHLSLEFSKRPTWALDFDITTFDQKPAAQRIVGGATRIRASPPVNNSRSVWVAAGSSLGEDQIRFVSVLKQRGHGEVLQELLREVDARVSGVELLAPGGELAELFIRLDNGTPMLPVVLMGEGFQRCLEIGAAAAVHDWPTLFIDEIENGMHHLVLEPLWRWIAKTASRRSLQVFATTHSEECIQAAASAFKGLGDDGLRVIRLDRSEGGTRASVYDRGLIEVAGRTGTEIRG